MKKLKGSMPAHDNTGIFSDILHSDVAWFCQVISKLEGHLAQPGETGPSIISTERQTGIYRLKVIVATGMQILTPKIPSLVDDKQSGITIVTCLDFGLESPLRTLLAVPRAGSSHLEVEIVELRKIIVG